MGILSSLKRSQKEAVGLLQIGTFLEYFDLMLYVHMAVILNDLFFPETDPTNAQLLSAFAFCSSFAFRPIGAYIFGKIGDTVGRKATVIITTSIMSITCLVMALLPTYDQIGIAAAWIVSVCRIAQGLSSMGEVIGAQVYLTEMVKPPLQYPVVGLVSITSAVGSMAALGVALLTTIYFLNWRYAFVFGAVIAVVGAAARTRLKESTEFSDMQHRMKKIIEESREDNFDSATNYIIEKKREFMGDIPWIHSLAYFCTGVGWPACFYYIYMYYANILKTKFGYSGEEIIIHNFKVSIYFAIISLAIVYLTRIFHPLKIAKFRNYVFLIGLIPMLYIGVSPSSIWEVVFLQAYCGAFCLTTFPADPVIFHHFPIFRRFTCVAMSYAISRALMYLVTSFGLIYLSNWFGDWGLLVLFLPCTLASLWGFSHFQKLEREKQELESPKSRGVQFAQATS